MPTPEQEAHRASLPVHPEQHRTGAVPIDPSPKDYPAYLDPRIWANARAGNLQPVNLLQFVKEPRYDQGATGACVANSTAGNCTLAHSEADGSWPMYAAQQLYAEAGGTGQNGVDARTVLEICRKQGTPLLSGGREVVVQSYVFVDTSLGVARTQIKAALAAGLSVLVAALLPIPFSWTSGTAISQGYHQFLVVGWMVDDQGVEWFILVNSWGDNWPGDAPPGTPHGVGRIRCDVLESASEQGYFYAIVPTDLTITPPVPTPTPTPIPTPGPANWLVQGNAKGTGTLTVNQPLTVSGAAFQGTFIPTDVHQMPGPDPGPDPRPQPQPDPGPDPAPNGDIQVMVTVRPSGFRNTVSIIVYTADRQGHSFPASVNGTVTGSLGTVPLSGLTTHGTGGPSIWTVQRPAPWGEQCSVTVNAFNGTAEGSATKPG